MEYFDLVDKNDNVIGVTTKAESHDKGLLHRCIAIYVFDKNGDLYIQEHIKSGGKYDHSVGGHVSKGEGYDEAAEREAREELGLTDPLSKLSVFYSDESPYGAKYRHMFGLYECVPSERWKFEENEEVKNIFLMPIEEIVSLMNTQRDRFTGGFLNTMNEYLRIKSLPYSINIKPSENVRS